MWRGVSDTHQTPTLLARCVRHRIESSFIGRVLSSVIRTPFVPPQPLWWLRRLC